MGGRAEQSIGSVGIVAAIGTAQDGSCGVFAAQRQQKHILVRPTRDCAGCSGQSVRRQTSASPIRSVERPRRELSRQHEIKDLSIYSPQLGCFHNTEYSLRSRPVRAPTQEQLAELAQQTIESSRCTLIMELLRSDAHPIRICRMAVTHCHGAAQLDAEAGAARLRSGGRAALSSASVTASRRLHRAPHMQAGGAPLRLRHVGPGRAA